MNKTTVQMSKKAKIKFDMIKAKLVAQGKQISTDLQLFDYLAKNVPEKLPDIINNTNDYESVENRKQSQFNLKLPIQRKAKKIKIVLTDVDGVLTDGGRYFTSNGEAEKRFDNRDGMGVNVLLRNKIKTIIVTKEISKIVKKWAKEMNVTHVMSGIIKKELILKNVCEQFNVIPQEVAYIGDDINDLELMKNVGLSATPKNSDFTTKKIADYICNNNGGHSAFREFADLILYSKFPHKKIWY